jgi:hypothetical protein
VTIDRRKFISGVIGGASVIGAAGLARAATPPCPPSGLAVNGGAPASDSGCGKPGVPLLTAADFRYLGYYDIERPYGGAQGFTTRRVGSETRLLLVWDNQIIEYSLAGKPYNSALTSESRTYSLPTGPDFYFIHNAMYFDNEAQRVIWSHSDDYTTTTYPTNIYTFALNDATGQSYDARFINIQGLSQRWTSSGITKVPANMQSKYGFQPYMWGMGHYESIVSNSVLMGFSCFGTPDPTPLANNATIPLSSVQTLSKYPSGPPGRRLYYGGTDGPFNQIQSNWAYPTPGPDGKAPMMWFDRYDGVAFIEGPNRRGVIAPFFGVLGRLSYIQSSVQRDGNIVEIHIFDPDDLKNTMVTGSTPDRPKTAVSMFPLTETKSLKPNSPNYEGTDTLFWGSYDPYSQRLFVFCWQWKDWSTGGNTRSRVFVYQVNS